MEVEERLYSILSDPRYTFLFFLAIGVIPRIVALYLIPVDWNPDSYHHWQISFLTLRMGLREGRLWDLNGCEFYWGVIPHLVQALLQWILGTPSIVPYRALNIILGGVNTYLVYLIGRDNVYWKVGMFASVFFALFPIGIVFDIVAMQETLALSFALLSLHYFNSKPGRAGIFLALAAQSRTEFWLVSMIFVICAVTIERGSERAVVFTLSWFIVMGIFCFLYRLWTSNPFYPLYWSLFNVFGGWTERGRGLPLPRLMLQWLSYRMQSWPSRASGQILLGSAVTLTGSLVQMLRRPRKGYHLVLFFLVSTVVFGPLFLPYYPEQGKHLLYMLRMSLPIAASGAVLLFALVYRTRIRRLNGALRNVDLGLILTTLLVIPGMGLIPSYTRFQEETNRAFSAADDAYSHYEGGTIVCDHPTMNYRLVTRWGVGATELLGNHYSPHYYGISNPQRYAEWLAKHNVTLWLYSGNRAYPVWAVVSKETPGLLVYLGESHGTKIYEVNRTLIEELLTG